MNKYRLKQDRLKKKIYITKSGMFGETNLQVFSDSEYGKAMEYVKQIAAKNRPSRVSMLDGQGNIRRQWEYAPTAKPKSYETKPRKNK